MNLRQHIKLNHDGNVSEFARSISATRQQVNRWIKLDCIWRKGRVYAPKTKKTTRLTISLIRADNRRWEMGEIDKLIFDLFNRHWVGESVTKSIDNMKEQLHKNLLDQTRGYWSGSSAYRIMTTGGFLIDAKSCTYKKLTALGQMFMDNYGKVDD